MSKLLWILIVGAGVCLLLKAALIGIFIIAMVPVVLVLRFVVRPIIAPQSRTPLVDPLNDWKPIKK